MRITCTIVFIVTLIVAWVCFASIGDYNLYVVYPDRKVIKDMATVSDRVLWGGLYAFIFAAADTIALWIWQRLQSFYTRKSHVSESHIVA
jgi:hypothetical protein